MKKTWLWDVKRTDREARAILSNPENKLFLHYAALLLARSNEPKEVFGYIAKEHFCQYWQQIKRRMVKDKWNSERAVFWGQIYKYVVRDFKMRGGIIRAVKVKMPGNSLAQKVGSAIKDLRMRSGMSQQELADKAGIKQQIISRIESGTSNPSLQTIEKIKKHLTGDIDIVMLSEPSRGTGHLSQPGEATI